MAPKQAPNTNSRAAILKLIESTAPNQLQKALVAAVPNTSESQLKMLSEVLAPLAKTASVKKHCVRCHKTFLENQNHPKACTIEHAEGDCERTRTGDDAMTVTLYCCGLKYDSDDNPPTKFCIAAPHTIEPSEVEYYDEDEDGDSVGNENVVTCEENGCAIKKRKAVSMPKGERSTKKRHVILNSYYDIISVYTFTLVSPLNR